MPRIIFVPQSNGSGRYWGIPPIMNGGISSQLNVGTTHAGGGLVVAGVTALPDVTESSSKSSCVLISVVKTIVVDTALGTVPKEPTVAIIHWRSQWWWWIKHEAWQCGAWHGACARPELRGGDPRRACASILSNLEFVLRWCRWLQWRGRHGLPRILGNNIMGSNHAAPSVICHTAC